MAPSLAHAGAAEPATEDGAGPKGNTGSTAPDAVLHPDLAEQAPQPGWVYEGEGQGTGGVEVDARAINRKIRRAGRVTLAGAGIAVTGALLGLSGLGLYFAGSSRRLNKLASDSGGALPVDDPKRQRIITMAHLSPYLGFAGAGVLVAGVLTAAIARSRLKKLRELRRTSIIAVTPTQYGRGLELQWEVRF